MLSRATILKITAVCLFAGVFTTLSWALVDTTIHATGDHEFCTSCHSHAPIGSSYRESIHGGNNPTGWRATCSQCHIPQDNSLHYLWVKGVHGVVDPTMEILKDTHDIDWHANRERREHYVYDSGCLSCHKYLATATQANRKSFRPHRKYFNDEKSGLTCVGCHEHVGHSNLGTHLQAMGWEKNNEN
ncbi:cytochrome c-type protein NapC [Alteromonadaceae bacterium 2753L.S.0a.02]|nr:cytochrome c-type protein NapC [Alteromonadaceae bacterium 2753L.S.0a.02]